MRVRDVNSANREVQTTQTVEPRAVEKGGLNFQRHMTDATTAEFKNHIADLSDKIHQQGLLVAKRADIKELQRYREMITELLNDTVSNSYEFTKHGAFDARGRHRVFAFVKRINADLDEMTKEVLKEESDNIRLLNLVDDIRGLIIDIFA